MPKQDKPLTLIISGGRLSNNQLNALLSALENISTPGVVVTYEPELTDKQQKILLTTGIGLSLTFNLSKLEIPTTYTCPKKQSRSWRPQDAFKKKHRHKLPNKPRK